MAEQSYLFDFHRTDDFFEQFNLKFKISDMFIVTGYDETEEEYTYEDDTVSDNFKLTLVYYGGDNIGEYLDSSASYSKLDTSVVNNNTSSSVNMALDWYNRGNGEATIELHDDVEFDIGDTNVPIKAVFLSKGDYVMGYSINNKSFSVANKVVFDDDVIFWDISRFNQ